MIWILLRSAWILLRLAWFLLRLAWILLGPAWILFRGVGCPPNSAAARRAIGCAGPTEASASQSAKRRERDGMRTAYCFTPDRAFFAPAIRAIASLIEAEPDGGHEIILVCEPNDVPPGFDNLAGDCATASSFSQSTSPASTRTSSRAGAFRAPCFAACFSTKSCPRASSASFRSIPTCSSSARAQAPRKLRSRRQAARRGL